MPSRKVHNYVCKLFGIDPEVADKVNRDIDYPSRFLGKKHRILFHDVDVYTLLLLSKYNFESDALLTWYLHKLTDDLSRDKNLKIIFKILELL